MADGKIAIPTPQELQDQFLRDIRLAAIDTGLAEPPTQPGTDWFLLATASANLGLISLANTSIAEDDANVLTATGKSLDRIRVAEGLPEVPASGSSGKIRPTILGATTILDGTQLLLPNGLRIKVVGTYINPADGDEINVAAIDTGAGTNLPGDAIVRFVSAPVNVNVNATVSAGEPLTGGSDVETDQRKRARILNVRQNKPAGNNWAHLRQLILDQLGNVQDVYIYPALGGPSSQKIVPVKDFDLELSDFSRAPSSSALAAIRSLLFAQAGIGDETIVQASVDQAVDFSLVVTLPDSALSGGNGQGWSDQMPWPPLVGGDNGKVTITAVGAGNDSLILSALTTTAPVAGQTNIAWWSAADRKFYSALVILQSGGAGAWVVGLDRPLVGRNGAAPAIGDYVSPAAHNLQGYGGAWVELFRALGPGEATSDSNRIPRAKRHPFVTDEDPSDVTTTSLLKVVSTFPEITAIAFGTAAVTTPTIPADTTVAVNILVPGKFGVYKT